MMLVDSRKDGFFAWSTKKHKETVTYEKMVEGTLRYIVCACVFSSFFKCLVLSFWEKVNKGKCW